MTTELGTLMTEIEGPEGVVVPVELDGTNPASILVTFSPEVSVIGAVIPVVWFGALPRSFAIEVCGYSV